MIGVGEELDFRGPLQKAAKVLFALSNKLEEPQQRAALDYGRPPGKVREMLEALLKRRGEDLPQVRLAVDFLPEAVLHRYHKHLRQQPAPAPDLQISVVVAFAYAAPHFGSCTEVKV